MTAQPYIPKPDELNLEFYKSITAAGMLCIQHCRECGTWTHPARYFCPSCTSPDFNFDTVSGRANVHSYTVSHFTAEAAWKEKVPYVTIVAELEEGPRIVAASRDISSEQIVIGQNIRIVTETLTPEFAFLWAEAVEGPQNV